MGILGITNDGSNDMVVAGRVIPAGETRHFDAHEVPLALRPESAAPKEPPAEPADHADPLHQLQGESVSNIKEALPTLEAHQLVALCRLEEETGKPRSTLLAAIQEEQLRRASESRFIGEPDE